MTTFILILIALQTACHALSLIVTVSVTACVCDRRIEFCSHFGCAFLRTSSVLLRSFSTSFQHFFLSLLDKKTWSLFSQTSFIIGHYTKVKAQYHFVRIRNWLYSNADFEVNFLLQSLQLLTHKLKHCVHPIFRFGGGYTKQIYGSIHRLSCGSEKEET